MPDSIHAGEVLASRYRLDDLLAESEGGRFWRAHDAVLHRHVAVHLIPRDDPRAEGLLEAARNVAPHLDPRLLRVLDAERLDDLCFVVNEWGQGTSLDVMLANDGPLQPRRAAWIVSEVADSLALAHAAGLAHGRLVPENVLVDHHGQVRIIGFGVDAALHGLPPGRRSADLVDAAALLYAALTGKWAGVSSSQLPAAPTDHGAVLRPRRVRAGIPRALDALCDQVINSGRSADAGVSAAVIAEMLRDYVGDASGMRESTQDHTTIPPWAPPAPEHGPGPAAERATDAPDPADATRAVPSVSEPTRVVAPVPTGEDADPDTNTDADVRDEPDDAGEPPRAGPVDQPTQAGMPVFDDERDEIGWVAARSDPPPPPPPFEERPAKPLFAPEPPEGQPARRPREGFSAATSSGYWPWEGTSGGHQTGSHTGTGAASLYDTGTGDDDVPGRSWIRLALLIGLCLLVALAALAAYQIGRGGGDEPTAEPPGTPVTTAPPTPFPEVTGRDFDPQGTDGQVENSDLVPLALDGNTATSWNTSSYNQQLGPGGLKTGVGLVLDLGRTRGVRQVDIATLGGPTSLAVYITGQAPSGVADLTPVGDATGSGTLTVELDEAVSGRFVTVWLTALPQLDGTFRGTIADVVVAG
ncbi:protein kinase family protein [Nocardioides terrigena]|uniref:protein kinase family protein n=1 Tax=Nocardioides terrigena TaxID=424797 RepID=UPI000D318E12|nr:protein kinase [Nocardioides terrigena]